MEEQKNMVADSEIGAAFREFCNSHTQYMSCCDLIDFVKDLASQFGCEVHIETVWSVKC